MSEVTNPTVIVEGVLRCVKTGAEAVEDFIDDFMENEADAKEVPVKDLAKMLLEARQAKEVSEALATKVKSLFDKLRLHIIPTRMEEIGSPSMRFPGIGRLSVTADAYVNLPKENRAALHEWLRAHGYSDLVVPFVHSSTLKAEVKRMVIEGEEYPADLVNFEPFMRATITKS